MCGPGSAVAPYIRGLTPDSAGKGTATVPVTLTGDRFQAGATLRVIRPPPALPETVPTTFTSAQQLQATLDLSTDPVQTVYLRVVNPDKVISPVVPFRVVPVSPAVTAWTPSPLVVLVGPAPATLHATGTGLTTGSQCHLFSRVTSVETVLPTFNQTGTALDCTLDTTGLSLGEYDLWVVNDGLLASAKSTLSVTSDQLTLTSLSPSSGAEGSTQPVSVTVYGSGFNNTAPSRAYLSTTAGGSTFTAQVTSYVDPTRLLAQFDLTSLPAGANYKVRVSNGGTHSNTVDFAIVANPPTVTSVSFSPQPIYQNATETLTFNGTNLTGGNIRIRKPDATIVSPTTTGDDSVRTASQVFSPSSAWPPGTYTTYLEFAGSTSAPTTFTILSNVAILSAVSPAGGDQGTTIPQASPLIGTLTLTGANFFTGMRVFVQGLGAAGADVEVTPVAVATPNSATAGNLTTPLSLVNRNTGVYRIVARNTGAADSNTLGFSVTPAVPVISGVSICTTSAFTTCSPATATTQSATPIYLKISGSNFAKPDVNGNGGSQLVAWNTGTVPPIASPTTPINVGTLSGCTVTANDYASIHVTFDSRAVFATTSPYTLQIWNPGGVTPPQKSGTTPFTVNP
jgi:hypothetical protein